MTTAPHYYKAEEEKTELLRKALGVDQQTIQTIVKKHSRLLQYKHETLMERIKWYQDYLDMNGKEVARLISGYGGLDFGGSIEVKEKKIAAFQSLLGLDEPQVKKLIRMNPNLLAHKLTSLNDKAAFIAEFLGFDPETDGQQLGKVFLLHSYLLVYTKETIISKVEWYQKTLGLDKEDSKKWIRKDCPRTGEYSASVWNHWK